MSYRKSELQMLEDDFEGTWDFDTELRASNNSWNEELELDQDYKAHQLEMIRQDPYFQDIQSIERKRRGANIQMVDIDLMS